MTLYLRRRAIFSAGFSKPFPASMGAGHDYVVDLTVGGEIDPASGMVVNIKDIDAVLKEHVVGPLHGRLLDRDVPAFRRTPPTVERLTNFVWASCASAVPPSSFLAQATVIQSPMLRAEWTAPGTPLHPWKGANPLLTLTRTYDFSASHRLHSSRLSEAENDEIFGKCNWINGHGHNYEIEITLAGEPDPHTGQIAPLDILDRVVEQEILTPLDHRHLNFDVEEFRSLNPTSENLTKVIWDRLARHQAEYGAARLHRVLVRETARNYFEYYGESSAPLRNEI